MFSEDVPERCNRADKMLAAKLGTMAGYNGIDCSNSKRKSTQWRVQLFQRASSLGLTSHFLTRALQRASNAKLGRAAARPRLTFNGRLDFAARRRSALDAVHYAATMFRQLSRRSIVAANRQWLKAAVRQQRSYASALGAALKISSLPAPHAGTITVLSLDRPKARNAISKQLLSELNGVVEGLHKEGGQGSTRALILASECDNAFCAGADLKERLDMTPEEYENV